MAYFRNNAINLLNLHYGIHSLALTGSGAFYTVFLLKAGVPVPDVLASLAAILFGRFLLRPFVLPLMLRYGLKPLLIAGSIGSGLQYPFLAQVHGVGPALYLLIFVSALGDSIYWTSYHAFFASLGDAEHRGHQVGVREAMAALIGILAPLLAGWALVAFGPQVAFDATALVLFTAAIPLFWIRNVAVPVSAPRALKAALPGVLLFLCDGWIAAGLIIAWRLALFIALGESYQNFGAAVAAAALVGALSGLFLGRLIDAGHGTRAAWITLVVLSGYAVLCAASAGHPTLAVSANAFGAFVFCIYTPTLMTVVYNKSKRSPCVARFHIATEGGWDIGGSAGLLAAALLVRSGGSLGEAVLLSLVGILASFLLLRRHHAEAAEEHAAMLAVPITARAEREAPEASL